jgi:predicted Rossmann fold nucleotide-binding protein DprA/Smf involved in DNA uptake
MNPIAGGRQSSSASLEAWMKLRAIDGVGDQIVLALVREWESPEAVLGASMGDLMERGCSARPRSEPGRRPAHYG